MTKARTTTGWIVITINANITLALLLHFIRLDHHQSRQTDVYMLLFSVVLHHIGTIILLQCGGTQQASMSRGGERQPTSDAPHYKYTYILPSVIVCHKYLTMCGYWVPFP